MDQWTTLDFGLVEGSTNPAQVVVGPGWRWFAFRETYVHLVCSMQIQRVPGDPLWQLRVVRSGMEDAIVDARGPTAQIAWIGRAGPQEWLQVDIRPLAGPPVLFDSGSPRSAVVIHGHEFP